MPNNEHPPHETPPTVGQQLRTAMQLTDVIRRHDAGPKSTKEEDNDPLQPLRIFLETPGVKQSFMVATVCLGVFFPLRRVILRVADQQLKLGTIFPDLVVTPTMAVVTAQISLLAGSIYGSTAYLRRLADIPADEHSPTVDAICNDPVVTAALYNTHSSNNTWDPREQTIHAMQGALIACRVRREYQKRDVSNAVELEPPSPNSTSWWRYRS